ncbi:MAG: pyridoxamine 5'-phosphate oxidase family protein [Acidimicrobiales bacterium]
MTTLDDLAALFRPETGLATLSVARPDASVHSSLVNAGLLAHPLSGEPVAGVVVRSDAAKMALLRRAGRATLCWRSGWRWITLEGGVALVGPNDPLAGFDPAGLPALLRAVYQGCGGVHDDWSEFDRVMAAERRAAVLVAPGRLYTNRA